MSVYFSAIFTLPASGETITASEIPFLKIICQNRHCGQMVHRDTEKALNLWRVKVDSHDPINTYRGKYIRHHFSRYRFTPVDLWS